MKLASVNRAPSYLVNLNWPPDLKFDIVCDNGVSLQALVLYMKFSKEVPVVVGWSNAPFYPSFAPAAASQAYIFFWKSFMCVTCNNK